MKKVKLSKETEELFTAPWKPYRPIVGLGYEVRNRRDETIIETDIRDYACQISRLPELYESLVKAVKIGKAVLKIHKVPELNKVIEEWEVLIKNVKEGE